MIRHGNHRDNRLLRQRIALSLVVGLCILVIAWPVMAAELDPFDVRQSSWTSLKLYRDRERQSKTATVENKDAKPPPAEASAPPQSSAPHADHASAPVEAKPMPSPRVDSPTLPGINKGFDVHVDTTADDVASLAANQDAASDDKANDAASALDDQRWRDAQQAAHGSIDDDGHGAQDQDWASRPSIRFATLPNRTITPMRPDPATKDPSPNGIKTARASEDRADKSYLKPRSQRADKKTAGVQAAESDQPSPAAALAALAAMRKRQMQALASDQATLRALQQAIKDLGLENKLNFTGNASSTLTADAPDMRTGTPAHSTP